MRTFLVSILFFVALSACAPQRPPIPPGEVPQQSEVSPEDEQYGHTVFGELSDRYTLETRDEYINRARDIVDKLATAASANNNPWHLNVFNDPSVVNAAATRGNYIFIWSGLYATIQNDAELAAVLAHEMGHVLAGHTQPTAEEEVNEILAEVSGTIAQGAVGATAYGALADIAGALISELVKAAIVNPESQRLELEADQIGLFLMADAGYDPQHAIDYWKRAMTDPRFSSGPAEFLSSHPATETRLQNLLALLPEAEERYKKSGKKTNDNPKPSTKVEPKIKVKEKSDDTFAIDPTDLPPPAHKKPEVEVQGPGHEWRVKTNDAPVFAKASEEEPISNLESGTTVLVTGQDGVFLKISEPVVGYMRGKDLKQ